MSQNRLKQPHHPVTLLWLSLILCFCLGYVTPTYYPDTFSQIRTGFGANTIPSLRIQRIPKALRPQYRWRHQVRPEPLPQYRQGPLPPIPPQPFNPLIRSPPIPTRGKSGLKIHGFNNNTIVGNFAGNVNVCVNGSGGGTGPFGGKRVTFKGFNNNNINGSFSGNVNNGHIYVNIDMGSLNVSSIFSNKHFLKAIANVTELRAEFLYKEIKRLQKLEERNRLKTY